MSLSVRSPTRGAPNRRAPALRSRGRRVLGTVIAAMLVSATAPCWAQRGAPPHAPLFGVWTGGFFPVAGTPDQQTCHNNASVEFGQDVVGRATLTESQMSVRVIETVRATPQGWEFRFAAATPAENGVTPGGFGCNDPDALSVQRRGTNEIAFPGCADFPFPLVRCPGR